LAGSTIMLITIPFACTIWLGQRKLNEDGEAPPGRPVVSAEWSHTDGIIVDKTIPNSAKIMMLTSLSFFIIQVPALMLITEKGDKSSKEQLPALVGLVVALCFFVLYSIYQIKSATSYEIVKAKEEKVKLQLWQRAMGKHFSRNVKFTRVIFERFDKDKSGQVDVAELKEGLSALGLDLERSQLMELLKKYDENEDHVFNEKEFESLAQDLFFCTLSRSDNMLKAAAAQAAKEIRISMQVKKNDTPLLNDTYESHGSMDKTTRTESTRTDKSTNNENGPDLLHVPSARTMRRNLDKIYKEKTEYHSDEEEEFLELTDEQLRNSAFMMLVCGTLLVTTFSDPMCEVITAFADTSGIPAFYISFILTPLASNAAEVIASLRFAAKGTQECVSLSLASLYGAACMNNTFCLSIFFALIYIRELEWDFTAETLSMLLVMWTVGLNGLNSYYRNWQGYIIASLLPLSIMLIALLNPLDGSL